MSRLALSAALLVAVYALALDSAAPADLVLGALAAVALLLALRRFCFPAGLRPLPGLGGRLLAFPVFALSVAREMATGTWRVATTMAGLRPLREPRLVEVPLGERTPLGAAVSGLVATLAPGEALVEIDETRGVLVLHALDGRDPDAIRARYARLYAVQRRVFP